MKTTGRNLMEDEDRRAWFRQEILPLEPHLLQFAERLARPGQTEASDLVHDVLVKLIVLDKWRELECPAAYAKQMLRNLAVESARRSTVVVFGTTPGDDILSLVDDAPDAEKVAIARDELSQLRTIIEGLPEGCRRVFTLRKIYDLSPSVIAEQLGLSVSTVEKHVTKGLRICTEKLAREPRLGAQSKARSLWARTLNKDEQ